MCGLGWLLLHGFLAVYFVVFCNKRVTQKSKSVSQAIGCKTPRLVPLRVTSPQIRSCKGSETRSTGLSEKDAELISEHQDEKPSTFFRSHFKETGETCVFFWIEGHEFSESTSSRSFSLEDVTFSSGFWQSLRRTHVVVYLQSSLGEQTT